MDLGSREIVSFNYSLELPAGMRLERLPDKVSVKSEFGEVTIELSMNDNILVAAQTISCAISRIPPEKYPDFRDFVNTYLRSARQRVRLVSATP